MLPRRALAVLSSAVALAGCAFVGSREVATIERAPDVRLGSDRFRLARPVRAIAFSPDSKRLAAAGEDDVVVWEVPSGELAARLRGHAQPTTSVAFLTTSTLVSASEDGSVRAWDTAGVEHARILQRARSLAASPDGARVAIATDDGRVLCLDADLAPELVAVGSPGIPFEAVCFSPDGGVIAATGGARPAFFDARTGRPIIRDRGGCPGREIAFSPTGRELAFTCGDHVYVNVFPIGRRLEDLSGAVSSAAFREFTLASRGFAGEDPIAWSRDGRALAIARKTVQIVDPYTGAPLHAIRGFSREIEHVAYSPDGTVLAVVCGQEIALFSAPTLAPITQRHRRRVTDLAFSPEGKLAATVSLDGALRLWESETGKPVACIDAGEPLASVAFSPDGRTVYAGDERGQIHVVDARSREARESFEDRAGGAAIAVSPDGRTLASVGRGTLGLFSTRTGLLERPETLVDADRIAFLPDGATLALGVCGDLKLLSLETGDGAWPLASAERGPFALGPNRTLAVVSRETSIVIRDIATGEVRATFEGEHAARIRSLALASTGALLASASEDGCVLVRDLARGNIMRILLENKESERTRIRVAFTPDGHQLALYGEENDVAIWRF